METIIKISLRYAEKAYEAITDNRYLEENTICEYPDVWIIEEEDEYKHSKLLDDFIYQLDCFGIPRDEYNYEEINFE